MSDKERRRTERIDKQKKRKRHTEEELEERPSKKPATESIAETLKFSMIESTAESAPAIRKSAYSFYYPLFAFVQSNKGTVLRDDD